MNFLLIYIVYILTFDVTLSFQSYDDLGIYGEEKDGNVNSYQTEVIERKHFKRENGSPAKERKDEDNLVKITPSHAKQNFSRNNSSDKNVQKTNRKSKLDRKNLIKGQRKGSKQYSSDTDDKIVPVLLDLKKDIDKVLNVIGSKSSNSKIKGNKLTKQQQRPNRYVDLTAIEANNKQGNKPVKHVPKQTTGKRITQKRPGRLQKETKHKNNSLRVENKIKKEKSEIYPSKNLRIQDKRYNYTDVSSMNKKELSNLLKEIILRLKKEKRYEKQENRVNKKLNIVEKRRRKNQMKGTKNNYRDKNRKYTKYQIANHNFDIGSVNASQPLYKNDSISKNKKKQTAKLARQILRDNGQKVLENNYRKYKSRRYGKQGKGRKTQNGHDGKQDNRRKTQNGRNGKQDNRRRTQNGRQGKQDNRRRTQNGLDGKQDNRRRTQNGRQGKQDNRRRTQNGHYGKQDNRRTTQNGHYGKQDNRRGNQNGRQGKQDNRRKTQNRHQGNHIYSAI